MSLKNVVKRIFNIPFVWNIFQGFVGANAWKLRLYPSVFDTKGKILDFGCSMGNSTEAFLDFEYYGVDVDCEAIRAAGKHFAVYPNIHFFCADILHDSFLVEDFDHILIACAAHHLSDEELKNTLTILFAKLKPGGAIHIFDPLSQPEKDSFVTKFFINHDQGRYIRTLAANKMLLSEYPVSEVKIFPSPNRFPKLEDMLYVRILKQ